MDSILSRIEVAAEKVSVIKAVLGNKAEIVGAAALTQERVERSDLESRIPEQKRMYHEQCLRIFLNFKII